LLVDCPTSTSLGGRLNSSYTTPSVEGGICHAKKGYLPKADSSVRVVVIMTAAAASAVEAPLYTACNTLWPVISHQEQ
jgi:hypothetical protein